MTETFDLKKVCEVCNEPIPDSFNNLLCVEHYNTKETETERVQREEEEQKKAVETAKQSEYNVNGITAPGYKENPEQDDKNQILANLTQFIGKINKDGSVTGTRQLLYKPTKQMYTFIKDYALEKTQRHMQFSKHIWQPTMIDVGCGSGAGSNLISQEASVVWGVDKNQLSIDFAREAFTRIKNGVYYSTQVTFDQVDIIKDADSFTFNAFDMVVAIEIIEHIDDYKTFLTNIIQKFGKKHKDGKWNLKTHNTKNGEWGEYTEWFISTPNRNHKGIQDTGPRNKFHVREWTSEEIIAVLQQYFDRVTLYKADGIEVPFVTNHTPIIARCSHPKV